MYQEVLNKIQQVLISKQELTNDEVLRLLNIASYVHGKIAIGKLLNGRGN